MCEKGMGKLVKSGEIYDEYRKMQLKRFKNNSEIDDNIESNRKMFLNRLIFSA